MGGCEEQATYIWLRPVHEFDARAPKRTQRLLSLRPQTDNQTNVKTELGVEQEMQHISIFYDVAFAFRTHLARFFGSLLAAE